MTSLLDILKETDLRVGITRHFASLTSHEALDSETPQRRVLLRLYGLGTNAGLVCGGPGKHSHFFPGPKGIVSRRIDPWR